jgi:tRNA(Ile)-lysidine synthase
VHKFVQQLITEWRRLELPFKDATVIIAVSGGADSTALLLAIADLKKRKKLDLEFVVAHFNHQLRGKDSDNDEKFVSELASRSAFEVVVARRSFTGSSDLEQRARNARYKFLSKLANQKNAQIVLTAHTMNDQAETVLMNIIRGSGPDGLTGIRSMRPIEEGGKTLLVRPLLLWAKRSETEGFCEQNDVDYRRDAMNDDLRFTRVKVRKQVLPLLAEINPKIIESLARLSELSSAETSTVNSPNGEFLELGSLAEQKQNALTSRIRGWLTQNRGSSRGLQLKHIEAVARLAKSRKSGRLVELPGGDAVEKSGGRLAFRHNKLE